jgi:8-oxo-dGTP diphosphatase/2-hydroxy-dATP diphosphatase
MEQTKKLTTLCIVHKHPQVLLGMKKRGFGVGRWNGFGGKVTEGESIERATIREMHEEAGIRINDLEKVGILTFEYQGKGECVEVHVFRAEECAGEPTESEEMKPQWFYIDEIPFKDMWPDDIYWFPLFLKRKKFMGHFLFEGYDTILKQTLTVVEGL